MMLSKSQAKAFFLVGTGAFSAIFIGLTIDTFQRIPKQTNASALSESAIRGKHLFDKKNCMGCHTIMGEGAYYAPELTKVYERRGEAFVKAMLKDPEAMYPGQRKMQNYKLNDQEIADLTEFLKWVGNMDLNGFPPKPDLGNLAGAAAIKTDAVASGSTQPAIFAQMCTSCHALGGSGGNIGPSLDTVGSRLDQTYLENWLRSPESLKPGTKMPKLPLTEVEIQQLAAYLSGLKGANP